MKTAIGLHVAETHREGGVTMSVEWQVNYGFQKFHEILIKIQKKQQKLPLSLTSIHDQNTIFIKISHIMTLQNHIHTNPYLEAHKP